MENEIIERVAKAIYENVGELYLMGDEEWKQAACAAIAAMREPTDAMIIAGRLDDAEQWQIMIDAALKSE